jgi:hypothetical protein
MRLGAADGGEVFPLGLKPRLSGALMAGLTYRFVWGGLWRD